LQPDQLLRAQQGSVGIFAHAHGSNMDCGSTLGRRPSGTSATRTGGSGEVGT